MPKTLWARRLPHSPFMRTPYRFTAWPLILLLGVGCLPAYLPYGEWGGGVYHDVPPAGMSHEAWSHALSAHAVAMERGETRSSLLTVIDYSQPSTQLRFWVVDLATGEVLVREYVAHAVQTGGTWATSFSNRRGSYRSSLGTFVTANTYVGIKGLSLRLRGLEPGINDNARARGIVIHGTQSVNALRAAQGRLGRTLGCPALPWEASSRIVDLIANGVVVFAWAPDPAFLAQSNYIDAGVAAVRLSSMD